MASDGDTTESVLIQAIEAEFKGSSTTTAYTALVNVFHTTETTKVDAGSGPDIGTLGSGVFLEAPCFEKVAFTDIHKASEDALHNEVQDQEEKLYTENIQLKDLAQEVNEVNMDNASETDQEDSRKIYTQVGDSKVYPYVTIQSEIREMKEDSMETQGHEAEEFPLAHERGEDYIKVAETETGDFDGTLNLGQERTISEDIEIEHEESRHPSFEKECQNAPESTEEIEKVESMILKKEQDDFQNVLVTEKEHAIPENLFKEGSGVMLGEASHPSSEETLQDKLESSETIGKKIQMNQEDGFDNAQVSRLQAKETENTLLVESSETINIRHETNEQQGVPEQRGEESTSVTDEAAVRDYDKPTNEYLEYIQDGKGGEVDEGGKDYTEQETLLTETDLKQMSRSTGTSIQDKDANESLTAPPLVKQQEQYPSSEQVDVAEVLSRTDIGHNEQATNSGDFKNLEGELKEEATPEGKQEIKFTEEKEECINAESTIHDTEQEDASVEMNLDLSRDETRDNGDNENSAEEMQMDTSDELGENDKVKDISADCLTDKVAKGYQDTEKEDKVFSQEAAKAEHEDLSLSSSAVKHETCGEREYFASPRLEDEPTNNIDKNDTSVEPPKLDDTTKEASILSGNISSRGDNSDEKIMQVKDLPQAPVAENITLGNTDDGQKEYELHEKKLENLSALSKEFETEREDFDDTSPIVKNGTSAEAEIEQLSSLEGEIGENKENKSLTDIQEVNTISEEIVSQDDKREEQKIQVENVPREPAVEKIISQSENTSENVMQMKHTGDEFIEESGTLAESPAKDRGEEYSDDREAKQLPDEIFGNLSILRKDLETEHSEQSIDPSSGKNETAVEGEHEELAVEEHVAGENVVEETSYEAKSKSFEDDNTEQKITMLEDVSPEPMEEDIIYSQNNTEENQVQTEDTSRQVTEDEIVNEYSAATPVSDGHIIDGEEIKEFHDEKYENNCMESLEEVKEQEYLIHDSSKYETMPGVEDENLKVQEHPSDEKVIEESYKAGKIVSERENDGEEKAEPENSSKNFTEDDHVTATSKVVEELPEEVSANGDDEKLTAETSPEDGKIIEETSPMAIISKDNETEEESMQIDGSNEQSQDKNSHVDTSPESLVKEKVEASNVDGCVAREVTDEQYEEENNLVDTQSESLEEKKDETSTDDGHKGKEFIEEVQTTACESISTVHAEGEREQEHLHHDSSISNHATITMEDIKEAKVEHNLKDEQTTGEASLSEGYTIHQHDSIDVVEIQKEDVPEKSMEERATPQVDKNEEQTAQIEDNNEELSKDEHGTSISPGYPIHEVLQRTTNDKKEEKEYKEQKYETFLAESTRIEKKDDSTTLDSSVPDDETAGENVKKLTADEDEIIVYKASSAVTAEVIEEDTASSNTKEFLANHLSPDDEGIYQKAPTKDKTEQATDTEKPIDELADLDKSEERDDQIQKEETPEQSDEMTQEYKMETTHEELTKDYHTGTSAESPDEKIVDITADQGKKEIELHDEMSASGDDEKLRAEVSPKDGKIFEEASPVEENIIPQDNETEQVEMQMESTDEQSPAESNPEDTLPESLVKEASETSTDDRQEAKEYTEEVTTTAREIFSIEHAEIVTEPKDLDHESSISNHATVTTEDNEEEIVEQTTRDASLIADNTIHQDDSDAGKIQKESALEESATPQNDKNEEQNPQHEDTSKVLTIDEHASCISPEYAIQEVLQRTSDDGKEENVYSEQKSESLLIESTEIEENREDAKLESSTEINETANRNVKLTADENIEDESSIQEGSPANTAEFIQDDTALCKGEEFLAVGLSPEDEGIDQKEPAEEKTEQATDTGVEIDELADLDKSDKYNDQMQKEGTTEQSEETIKEYKMETTHEELTKGYHTGISAGPPDEKVVDISADNEKKENELNEEMIFNRDDQKVIAEATPKDEKIIEEANPVAEIPSSQDETEEEEMQMEGTNEQSPKESNEQSPEENKLVDTPLKSLAKEKDEASPDNGHEAIADTSEKHKEENYHVGSPSESLEAKETEMSIDDGHEAKEFTEEVITEADESFSIEQAKVVTEPEDLDPDSSISNHATTTVDDDNEGVIVEQKQKDEQTTGEASISAGNTIHQDDNIDLVKIQKGDAPEKSMEESATPEDDMNKEHNAQIEDNSEELTIDEHATSISSEYPIQEVLQNTTNDGMEEKQYSEQKCDRSLTESIETEENHEDAKHESSIPNNETDNENVKDESIIEEASSAITAEVIQYDAALCKGEEFLAVSLSPDDEGIDAKALPKDNTEQAIHTGKEIDELADLDRSEKHNDEMQKETPEQSEEMTEEYKLETTGGEITREYHTGTSTESPDEKIVDIGADNEMKENELDEESDENHSVECTAIRAEHEDLGFQTLDTENVTAKISEDTSPSTGYSIPRDHNIEEKKTEIEYATNGSGEGSTVSHDDATEESYVEKDHINQQIEGNHATVTSPEVHVKIGNEASTSDENMKNESITEECENLTVASAQENNEMLTAHEDEEEETIQVSSAITAEQRLDNASLNTEQFLSTDSSEEGKGIEQSSEKDMAEDKPEQTINVLSNTGQTYTTNHIKEQKDQIQKEEIKEQPAEILEQNKMDKQTVLNDDNVTEVVRKKDGEEYEESASKESTDGILTATSDKLDEPTICLTAEDDSIYPEEKICEIPKEEESEADVADDIEKNHDVEKDMETEEAYIRNRSVHDRKDAFDLSYPEEVNEKQQTETATFEQSQSKIEEVQQIPQTDEETGILESFNPLLEPVVDEVNENQQELELKKQETRSTDETEVLTIRDQPRESAENKVSEKTFGKADVDEWNMEKDKELGSIHNVEESGKEIILETTTADAQASSLAAAAAYGDFTWADREESLSLGQNVDSGIPSTGNDAAEQAANEGHDVPDEVPDAHEKNYENEEETIVPITEVDGGATEVTETVKEALVADASEKSNTEIELPTEGHREADSTEMSYEDDQVNIPSKVSTDSKYSDPEEVQPTEEENSRVLIDDDTVIYESRKDSLENEENQDGIARGQDCALQTDTVTVPSEKNMSVGTSNRSIQEAENSASAEVEEQNQQYKASNPKTGSLLAEENLNSDSLIEKHEHATASGTEGENEKLTDLPSDSTKENTAEKRSGNDEVTNKEETEISLEVEYTINKEENETEVPEDPASIDQAPQEPEDNDQKAGIIQSADDRSDANNLQQDEMKNMVISSDSGQDEEKKAVYSNSITETQSSDITETHYNKPEASPVEETLDECNLKEERGQSSQNTTEGNDEPLENRENELSEERSEEESLKSDGLVKNIEHDTTAGNEETNENLTEHLFASTMKDATEERQRDDVNIQTHGRETTVADQVQIEHEDKIKDKGIHETAEYQSDVNYIQHDEMKTVISTELARNGEQNVTDLNSVTEADRSDITDTRYKAYDQPEPSIVEETVDDSHFPEERHQSSENPTKGEDELSEVIATEENLESDTLVEKHENEILAADNKTDEKSSRHPCDSAEEDMTEEGLRNDDAASTEEVGSNLDAGSTVNKEASESQNTENLMMIDQVAKEPQSVDDVKSIQETADNYQIGDKHLTCDEIKKKATDTTNITEIESSDIKEAPCKQPEASTVAETAEECRLKDEIGQSSQNTTEGNNEQSEKRIKEQVPMEPDNESKVLSIQEAADNHSDANELLHNEIKMELSSEAVTKGKEMAEDSNNIPETESSDKMEALYNSSEASIVATTLGECGVPEETGQRPDNNSKSEHQLPQINNEEVTMEHENENNAKSIQESSDRQYDTTDLRHDEMQTVTSSGSIQSENATNLDKTTEKESLAKVDTFYNESEASTLATTLEDCDLSKERAKSTTSGEDELPEMRKVGLEETEITAERSSQQTHRLEEIKYYETSAGQKTKQTIDNFGIMENEEGDCTDPKDIQTAASHLPITCKNEGSGAVEVEKTTVERVVSNSVEEETTCVSPSHNNWKHFEEIMKNEMEADEPPPPNEAEEQLQQWVPVEEEHSASTKITGTEADLKSLPNETEEHQFIESGLPDEKHKGALQTKEIAEENMERVQSLEEKKAEQIFKDENCLEEELSRELDVQILDMETNKSLQQKEKVTQEASTKDSEIIMQARDYSSEIQNTFFSQDCEKTTGADTIIENSLEETKDDQKDQTTGAPVQINTTTSEITDRKSEEVYKETTDVANQDNGSSEQIHEPHDELYKSEKTTNKDRKLMAKNSDITVEDLGSEEGSQLCDGIVDEVPYDQVEELKRDAKKHHQVAGEYTLEEQRPIGNLLLQTEELGSEEGSQSCDVIANEVQYDQVEELKGDTKKHHQVAGEYTLQEQRPIGDLLLQSEENSMETLERDSTTKEHKGEDNWQVVSAEDVSASQETGEEGLGNHGQIEEKQNQMQAYSMIKNEVLIEDTGKIESEKEDMIGGIIPDIKGEESGKLGSSEDPGLMPAATIIEGSKDIDVKATTPKKSHNLLSGVGSKVKQSISKVKKAITGKPSQPKNSSPKKAE